MWSIIGQDVWTLILTFILVDQVAYHQLKLISKWYSNHVKLTCVTNITQSYWDCYYLHIYKADPKYLVCTQTEIKLHHIDIFTHLQGLSVHTHDLFLKSLISLKRFELQFNMNCVKCHHSRGSIWLKGNLPTQLTHLALPLLPALLFTFTQLQVLDLRTFIYQRITLDLHWFPLLHTVYYTGSNIMWDNTSESVTTCYVSYLERPVKYFDLFPNLLHLCLHQYGFYVLDVQHLQWLTYLELRDCAKIHTLLHQPLLQSVIHNEINLFPHIKNQKPKETFCKSVLSMPTIQYIQNK